MTKKRVEKPRHIPTKRQLSQWQRQKRRQRLIFGSGVAILVAVFCIVGVGWYTQQYQPMHQKVIRVNDTEFNMAYYIKMLRFYGGGEPSYMSYWADEVVKSIEQNELIRQAAMELGFEVSDREVDQELKSSDPPLSRDYRDPVRVKMLIDKMGDEYFDQQVPESGEQRNIMAMLLESESQAYEVRGRLEGGESFSELAGELSLEEFSKSSEGDLGWRPRGVLPIILNSVALEDGAFGLAASGLSQPVYDEVQTKPVGYWIIEVLDRKEDSEEAEVRAMLLGSEEEAQEVKTRLESGEDFATLVAELSQYIGAEENQGNLGWLTPESMTPAFDEFVFSEEGEGKMLSEPVRDELMLTEGGYWLIEVLDIAEREIGGEDRDLLKGKLFSEWIDGLWNDPENVVEDFLDDEKKAWAVEQALRG